MRSPHRAEVYRDLWELDEGFAQVHRVLRRMRSIRGFPTDELARYSALTEEARAATLSYLLEIVGESETRKAGRLFSSRQARERRELPE